MSEPKRVLFVCIGNACRSQMAEAFARAYGSDVLVASSAGLFPAKAVPPGEGNRSSPWRRQPQDSKS